MMAPYCVGASFSYSFLGALLLWMHELVLLETVNKRLPGHLSRSNTSEDSQRTWGE